MCCAQAECRQHAQQHEDCSSSRALSLCLQLSSATHSALVLHHKKQTEVAAKRLVRACQAACCVLPDGNELLVTSASALVQPTPVNCSHLKLALGDPAAASQLATHVMKLQELAVEQEVAGIMQVVQSCLPGQVQHSNLKQTLDSTHQADLQGNGHLMGLRKMSTNIQKLLQCVRKLRGLEHSWNAQAEVSC